MDVSSARIGGGLTTAGHLLPRLAQMDGVELGPILVRDEVRTKIPIPDAVQVMVGNRFSAMSRRWRSALDEASVDVVLVPTEIYFGSRRRPVVLRLANSGLDPRNMREYRLPLKLKRAVTRALARRSGRTAACHLAVSDYAKSVGMQVLQVPESRIRVIRYGAPLPASVRPSSSVRRLLFVSHLYRYKNLHRLLEALAGVPHEWSLDVIGSPVEADYYKELMLICDRHSLHGKVRFRGSLGQADLAKYYAEADCFLWPCYAETFGHPLLEARSHGLPIVAARAASNPEILGDAAIYFDPFDVADMRSVLDQIIEHGIEVGDLPREYSWDAYVTEVVDVLRTVCGHR